MEAYGKQPNQESDFEKQKRVFLDWSKRKLTEVADGARAEFDTYPFDVVKDEAGTEYLNKSELSTGQRKMLSHALAMVGVLTMQTPDKDDGKNFFETEQSVQHNGGGEGGGKEMRVPVPAPPLNMERQSSPTISPEQFTESPEFFNEVSGYLARTQLRFDEVIFVDEYNRPLGDPVKLESFTIEKDGETHLVTPGPVNEYGILTDGIAGEWLEHKRAQLAREHPQAKQLRVLSVASHFEAALETDDEPALVAAIKSGRITTFMELTNYYADKEVIGGGGLTRRQYIEQHISFASDVPPAAQAVFREIMPGLMMQESSFNNGLVSRTGARGAGQFQPTTWEELGMEEDDILSFVKQVDAMGRYASTLYKQVLFHIVNQRENGRYVDNPEGERALRVLQEQLGEKELQVFIALCALNGYNTGASRIAEGVVGYLEAHNFSVPSSSGREVFTAVADFSYKSNEGKLDAYGPDGAEYVFRAQANAIALSAQPRTRVSVGFNF